MGIAGRRYGPRLPMRCDDNDDVWCVVFREIVDGESADGSGAHRRLEAVRLELERADDVRRQQLAEKRHLSNNIELVESQLKEAEAQVVALLVERDDFPSSSSSSSSTCVSSDDRKLKLSQPLDAKSQEFLIAERQRHLEEDREVAQRSDPDGQITTDAGSPSTAGVTRPNESGNGRKDDKYLASKSRETCACSNIFASDTASGDTGCGSLSENSDLFIDRHRLATLV